MSTKKDMITYVGMTAVAVAAAVLSFSALAGLAGLAGITATVGPLRLAWLLPISVDAYAITTTRVWLQRGTRAAVRRYARNNAIGAISLSVVGNAVYHALTATGAEWLIVIAVSAVPPIILGLVGHLHALISTEPAPKVRTPSTAAPKVRTEPRTAKRTDAELIAALATVEREPDGTVPVRRAATALKTSPSRATRVLNEASLLRMSDYASV